jgi:DNA-binding transcriptional MerR regulator
LVAEGFTFEASFMRPGEGAYVPTLQTSAQVVAFLSGHLGYPFPSPALFNQIGQRFRRALASFADANDLPWIKFGKDDNKLAVAGRRVGRGCGRGVRYGPLLRARGVLPPQWRTPAGCRVYDAAAVDRLKFIEGAQRLGLRLREIADLLAIRNTEVCPCEPAEQLLRRRMAELDAEMARLARLDEPPRCGSLRRFAELAQTR